MIPKEFITPSILKPSHVVVLTFAAYLLTPATYLGYWDVAFYLATFILMLMWFIGRLPIVYMHTYMLMAMSMLMGFALRVAVELWSPMYVLIRIIGYVA